jgi:hypothetical protein
MIKATIATYKILGDLALVFSIYNHAEDHELVCLGSVLGLGWGF